MRDKWILPGIVLLGAASLAILPRFAVDDEQRMHPWALLLVTILGLLAAVAVLLDRIADWYTRRRDTLAQAAQTFAGQKSLLALLALLDELCDIGLVPSTGRPIRLGALPAASATAAAAS